MEFYKLRKDDIIGNLNLDSVLKQFKILKGFILGVWETYD